MEFEARDEGVIEDSFVQIGADLSFARLDKGLQINELSQLLRISKHHLKSIEAGDFDSLPGPTYVAGYLRSFAQEIGLDGVQLAQRYRALLGEDNKGPVYSFPIDTQRPQRSGAMLASIIVIFTVTGYGGWYALGKPDVLTALVGEPQSETVAPSQIELPQIELAVTEPDDMAKHDVEPVDLAVASPPAADLSAADLPDASLAGLSDVADEVVTNVASAPEDTAAPIAVSANPVDADEIVEVVVPPVLEAAPETGSVTGSAVETDTAAASVDGTSEETPPVIGTLADTTPPVVAVPNAAAPAETMATSVGATELAAVDGTITGTVDDTVGGALTNRAADDLVTGQLATAAPDTTDDMSDPMSSQIGTGVAFARQRVPEFEITLRATGVSWVEIIRNDGEEVMAKLMRDGETYLVDSRDRLYLSTGNAGGLELVFNDGTVRSVGDSGEILRDLLLDVAKLGNQL